ncbi:tetratricopeptide repeat protein [candidate division WOR-3 bacterium]|nr:tetratricopeptide repeat protein [candidate division WOR-3 bacterium]
MKTSRRFCTLLFVDIVGFSSIAEKNDPEKVKKILESVFCKTDSIAKNFGGNLYQVVGDQIVFSFGVPSSLENQDERAVFTAFSIFKSSGTLTSESGIPISFHIGIHSGNVLCGHIEVNGVSSFSIVGDAINVASRLQQICPKNNIYVSERVVEATSHQFNYRLIGDIKFKGKKRGVCVYKFLSVKTERKSRRGVKWTQVPFVGRETETLSVCNYFKKKNDKHRLLLVTGEPGVGKTRFVEEFIYNHIKESESIKTRTLPYGADSFYSVKSFVENMLPGIPFGSTNIKDNEKTEAFLKSEGIFYYKLAAETFKDFFSGIQKINTERPKIRFLLKTLAELTNNRLNKSPGIKFVLVFEDLHWARKPLLDMIDTFIRELPPNRVIFILVARSIQDVEILREYRDKFERISNLHEMNLKPLKKEQSDSLISFILNIENIPPVLKDKIIKYSQGNPLFLEEITKMLVEKGIVWKENNTWKGRPSADFEVPQSVGEIILSRFDMLDEKSKIFLETASAVGYAFDQNLASFISGISDKETIFKTVGRNFISKNDEGAFIFNHILIRDSIYASLTNEEKTNLHGRIFSFLEKSLSNEISNAHMLAHHAEASGNLKDAFRYYLFSAHYDEKRYSFHHSIEYLDKCSDITENRHFAPQKTIYFDFLMTSGRLLGFSGNHQRSLRFFEKARSLPLNHSEKITYFLELSSQLVRMSRFTEARNCLKKALILAKKLKRSKLQNTFFFRIFMNKADVLYFFGDINGSHEYLLKAEKFISRKDDSDTISLRGKLADILNEKDEPLKALKIRLEIEKKASKKRLLSILSTNYNNLGVIYDSLGKPQKALLAYEKSNDIDRKTGYALGEAISSYNISTYYTEFGKNSEAIKWLETYHKINLKIENKIGEGYYNLGLAEVKYNKNEITASINHLIESMKIFSEIKSLNMHFYILQILLLRSAEIENSKLAEDYKCDFERLFSKLKNEGLPGIILNHCIVSTFLAQKFGNGRIFSSSLKRLEKQLDSDDKWPEDLASLAFLLAIFPKHGKHYERTAEECKKIINRYDKVFRTEDAKNAFRKRRTVSQIISCLK